MNHLAPGIGGGFAGRTARIACQDVRRMLLHVQEVHRAFRRLFLVCERSRAEYIFCMHVA